MLIEKMRVTNEPLTVSADLIGERQQQEPRIRISSLGSDLQKIFYDISISEDQREEITPQKQRIFSLGHILEQEIFRQLKHVIHDIDKVVHTGIEDHRGEEIKGELDCLYTDDYGTTYVVDVKTMSDSSFKKLIEHQDIKKSHYVYYVQLQMYMHFEGLEDSLILAYNKNNSEMAEVFCDYDPIFVREQLERINALRSCLRGEVVPPLEYPNVRYYKTRKVRNKDEYEGLGYIIEAPHEYNRYNPYIDTEFKTIDDPSSKGMKFKERYPNAVQ